VHPFYCAAKVNPVRENFGGGFEPYKRLKAHDAQEVSLPSVSQSDEKAYENGLLSGQQKSSGDPSQNEVVRTKNRILEEITRNKNSLELYNIIKHQNVKPDGLSSQLLQSYLSLRGVISDQKNLIGSTNISNSASGQNQQQNSQQPLSREAKVNLL
jgi:hypothetical protein